MYSTSVPALHSNLIKTLKGAKGEKGETNPGQTGERGEKVTFLKHFIVVAQQATFFHTGNARREGSARDAGNRGLSTR